MNASRISAPDIVLHNWQSSRDVNVPKVAEFLKGTFGTSPGIDSDFGPDRILAESCRVTDTQRRFGQGRAGADAVPGAPNLYDGHEILRAVSKSGLCPRLDGALHIIITDMLVCTYDDGDARYHARPIVASKTSLVSTAGMIWGPARSRQYYEDVTACAGVSGDLGAVESRHAPDHLTRGDARMQQVAEGYAMQAVFYDITREAFCDSPDCRLYDAHWQSEMMHAQIGAALCERHGAVIDGLT